MSKIDKNKVFDGICDFVLHELSAKETLAMVIEHRGGDCYTLLRILNEERKNRNAELIDWRVKPDNLVYGWYEWNSGGGCMIWSMDMVDGKSVHLTEECCVLVDIDSTTYWEMEDWEEQAEHVLAECDRCDLSQNRDVDFLFTPYVGQEIADAIKKDVDAICTTM